MPNFRRYYRPNALFFITNVTCNRIPYLESVKAVDTLLATTRNVQRIHPFRLLSYVVLPNHFHWLMIVDDEQGDFSKVMHSVKRNFAFAYKREFGLTGSVRLWQSRFWDHLIRDETDLHNHVDYIHWNPVKHGYVARPEDWTHSTYRYWLDRGYYQAGWGQGGEPRSAADLDFE